MEEIKKNVVIEFTNSEYNYISKLCNTMYNNLKKFPKNMRTPKFYILENIIKNHFTK